MGVKVLFKIFFLFSFLWLKKRWPITHNIKFTVFIIFKRQVGNLKRIALLRDPHHRLSPEHGRLAKLELCPH